MDLIEIVGLNFTKVQILGNFVFMYGKYTQNLSYQYYEK